MKKGISYLTGLAKARGSFRISKTFAIGSMLAAGLMSAQADIVAYDATTGITSWDFSTIITMLVAVASGALGGGVVVWGIYKGWNLAKRFIK